MSDERMSGSITTIIHDRGFGFLRGEDRISRWFHVKDVVPRIDFDLLNKHQSVTFIPIDMGKNNPAMAKGNGLRATDVRRA